MKKSIFSILALGAVLAGCHNSDIEFSDFDYQTISFATQTPVRTITLGDEMYADNSLDNEHAFMVKAVLGGVNNNNKERSAQFVIDPTLCDGIVFEDGRDVKPLPESYYSISTDRLVIKKGEVLGGFRVDLTDAFFADPASVDVNYVLPVVLTNSSDSILSGKPLKGVENPNRLNILDWSTSCEPKDYVLYAVKYKNPYHGCWLSKGSDVITDNGTSSNIDRNVQYWEKATLRYLTTKSLNQAGYNFTYAVPTFDVDGEKSQKNISCDLILTFDNNGAVTVSTETPGCTASGSGQWTYKGEKKAFADEDRDQLKLNYTFTIEYVINDQTGEKATYKLESEEVMCMRDRQNKFETFSFKLK